MNLLSLTSQPNHLFPRLSESAVDNVSLPRRAWSPWPPVSLISLGFLTVPGRMKLRICGSHEHDHSDDVTPALQFSLYQHIDFDNITTLNESVHGSGKAITKKEWTDRLSDQPEVASDADEQLIINVP